MKARLDANDQGNNAQGLTNFSSANLFAEHVSTSLSDGIGDLQVFGLWILWLLLLLFGENATEATIEPTFIAKQAIAIWNCFNPRVIDVGYCEAADARRTH